MLLRNCCWLRIRRLGGALPGVPRESGPLLWHAGNASQRCCTLPSSCQRRPGRLEMPSQPPPTVIGPPARPHTTHEGAPTRALGAPDGHWTAPEAFEGGLLTLPSTAGTGCLPAALRPQWKPTGRLNIRCGVVGPKTVPFASQTGHFPQQAALRSLRGHARRENETFRGILQSAAITGERSVAGAAMRSRVRDEEAH